MIMTKLFSSLALAGLMAGMLAIPAEAQVMNRAERSMERGLRSATSGQAAPLKNAMTQSQARRACQTEMRGSRESRSALRTKMRFCINEKMQGS